MQNAIAAMRETLLTVFAWLLPVAAVAWLVALSAESGVRPMRRLHRFICAFPPLERGLLVVFVSACVLWGALKPEGDAPPLNSPPRAPRMSLPSEAGGDGSPACAEDALGPDDADDDGDGLSNADEAQLGTNPHRRDTDEDGLDDGNEAGWIVTGYALDSLKLVMRRARLLNRRIIQK